jgi:DNA-binding transcriptional MocR family regulator
LVRPLGREVDPFRTDPLRAEQLSEDQDPHRTESELLSILGDWPAGPGSLHRKLAVAVQRAIDEGTLLPGERLPSERRLARLLTVSRTTVVAAYDRLRANGALDSRRGSGTRVAAGVRPRRNGSDGRVPGGRAITIFQRLIEGPGEVISLACASQEGGHVIAEALRKVVDNDLPELLDHSGYQPRGLAALRTAIAGHLTSTGLPTSADQVLVTSGAHQALKLAAELYVRRGSRVVVETPGWPGYFDILTSAGARLTGVPLDDDGVRTDVLAERLAGPAPALVCLMPTYHNPTGVLMTGHRRRAVARLAARHNVPVVEDHSYVALAEAGPDGCPPAPISAYGAPGAEFLTVGSLGKAVWGGLRIGWIRAPENVIDRLARRKTLADLGSSLLDQAVGARLLGTYTELIERRSRALRERLDLLERLLRRRLPEWRWRRPDGGAALWVELPSAGAAAYAQIALRHGVEVVPGAAMDPDGRDDLHLRVPFIFPPEVLGELVERLAGAWTEFRLSGLRSPPSPAPGPAGRRGRDGAAAPIG